MTAQWPVLKPILVDWVYTVKFVDACQLTGTCLVTYFLMGNSLQYGIQP